MAYTNDTNIDAGSFVPTTNIWDVTELQEIDVNSDRFKELLVRLYQYINLIAVVLNAKESAYYIGQEFNTSELYENPTSANIEDLRQGYRQFNIIGPIGAGLTAFNHLLPVDAQWTWVYIGGAATNSAGLTGYPIPYANAAGDISVHVTGTQIIIDNQSGVIFTQTYIILKYLKY